MPQIDEQAIRTGEKLIAAQLERNLAHRNKPHPRIKEALVCYGVERFCRKAEQLLRTYPKIRVVLGLPPSDWGPAGKVYCGCRYHARPAVRYERNKGIVGIWEHAGKYKCVVFEERA